MKMPRSDEELDKVREKILDSALDIIVNEGFMSLTMRRLASRIGMTAPNIYNYFSGKDELYITIVIKGFETLLKLLKDVYSLNDDPLVRAGKFMHTYVDFGVNNSAYYDIMFSRPTPKYNDYIGTPYEKLSLVEYTISMEIVDLATKVLADVTGGQGNIAQVDIQYNIIKVWSILHGMVSLYNSNMADYVAGNTLSVYEKIMDELIGSFFPV